MPTLAEMRAQAREHARQIDAVAFLAVQDLAARYGLDDHTVRAIPRERLPYITFGRSEMRRYDPRDVEAYEAASKRGDYDTPEVAA